MTKKERLIEEYVELLHVEVDTGDTEIAHRNADGLLCDLLEKLGCKEVVDVYVEIVRWFA